MHKPSPILLWPLVLIFASAFLVSPTTLPAQGQDPDKEKEQNKEPPDDGTPVGPLPPYKTCLKIYLGRLKRKSLMKRTEGRMLLAATKDTRALKVLTASYRKTEAPKDQVRYLLVGIILRYFTEADSRQQFAAWRAKNKKARDGWLWFWTLRSPWMAKHKDELMQIVQGKENVFLRAAALEALATLIDGKSEEPELAATITAVLEAPTSKPMDRSVLFESCAAVLLAQKAQVRSERWKPICTALIQALIDDKIHERSKLALSRRFAEIFDTPNLGFEPRMWMSKLRQGPAPKRTGEGTAAAFFGVRSLGERICYVIDASDSMAERLTAREKERLAALTGSRNRGKKSDSSLPIEKRLPWHKIKTRFDVAREYLKLSLTDLDKSKSFAVIMFGNEAEPLAATPRMVAATAGNIRRAVAALNKLEVARGNRRQNTNLHGGLLQAFRMTKASVVKQEEHVSQKALAAGCDTIYLLSDGEPSWDNFGDDDKRDVGDGVMNPETGKRFKSQQQRGYYWGPYGRKPHKHMMDDFQRLNLFRKVQIHCVGIGEADQGLLDKIAAIGLGRVVKIAQPGRK
ncbi:MAG: hypothetical protein ACYTGW_02065 [Planctomycetota bacterium]|jgi:hypothetical protein